MRKYIFLYVHWKDEKKFLDGGSKWRAFIENETVGIIWWGTIKTTIIVFQLKTTVVSTDVEKISRKSYQSFAATGTWLEAVISTICDFIRPIKSLNHELIIMFWESFFHKPIRNIRTLILKRRYDLPFCILFFHPFLFLSFVLISLSSQLLSTYRE